eukprot:GFUD01042487.1.p1 GENE.GFUD01042487.1~~GFUD01042487.1.p1  ORF type:complete len:3096 (+),score=601.77 GFUD01042487.1:67-9354(+)
MYIYVTNIMKMCQGFNILTLLVLTLFTGYSTPAYPTTPAVRCPVGLTVDSALFFGVSKDGLSNRAFEIQEESQDVKTTRLRDELKLNVGFPAEVMSMPETELLDLASMWYSLSKRGFTDAKLQLLQTKDNMRLFLEQDVLEGMELEEKEFLRWTIGKLSDQEVALIGCGVGIVTPIGFSCSDLEVDVAYSSPDKVEVTDVISAEDCRAICQATSESPTVIEQRCVVWSWISSTSICRTMTTEWVVEDSAGSVSGKVECGGSIFARVDRCYTAVESSLVLEPSGSDPQECKMRCRADKFLYEVQVDGVAKCQCTNQAPSGISNTPVCTVRLITTGLGWHSSFRFNENEPTSNVNLIGTSRSEPKTEFVDAKTFKDGAGQLTVILYQTHCVVFKVTADPQAEEDDSSVLTTHTYLDHRRWDNDGTLTLDKYDDQHKFLLKHKSLGADDNLLSEGSDRMAWKEVIKSDATAVTILPIFVKMDEKFYPTTPLEYDANGFEIDYNADSWTSDENMAGRPVPKGKWYNHILISHKSPRANRPSSEPTMTLIRILEDGKLLHILDRYGNQAGQFEVEGTLLKEPADLLTLTRGRTSFTMVASNSPLPDTLDPDDYSAVRGLRIVEKEEKYTAHAVTNYFTAVHMEFKIPVFDVAKIGIVDFLYTTYLAVLDRTVLDGENTRLRLFIFERKSGEYTVDTVAVSTLEFFGVFTKMHSFVSESGNRYLVVTKTLTGSDQWNRMKLFLVDMSGQLLLKKEIDDQNGEIVDMKPAEKVVAGSEMELLEIRKIDDGAVMQCRIFGFNKKVGDWEFDPLREVKTLSSDDHKTKVYKAVEVFSQQRRVYGMLFRSGIAADSLVVDMVRFPTGRMPVVDNRLQGESDIVARINMLERKIMTNTDSLKDGFVEAEENIDTYLLDSKSVVTGNWNIKTLKVGRVLKLDNLPSDTVITVNVKKTDAVNDEVVHTTGNFRNVLDVDLSQVSTQLETISSNLPTLKAKNDDLLLLDTGDVGLTQTVTSKVIVDNLMATNTFKLTSDPSESITPQLKVNILAEGEASLAVADLKNVYSTGQGQVISGETTFTGQVSVTAGLDTVKLSVDEDGTITTVKTADLLMYDEDQTFPLSQEFTGDVSVSGSISFGSGIKGMDEKGTEIEFSVDVQAASSILGDIKLNALATASGDGLTASHLASTFRAVDESDIVSANAETVEIKGKLIISTTDVDNFKASGNSIGIVGAKMNSHNIKTLYDYAAWTYTPSSLPSISDISFTKNVAFSNSIIINNDFTVININDISVDKYITKPYWDSTGECLLEGSKTLKSPSTFDEVIATSYNDVTLEKFVTKSTEQDEFSSINTFTAGTTLTNIVAGDTSTPIVDGKNLVLLLSSDIPSVISSASHIQNDLLASDMQFTKLKIGSDATLKITGAMNGIDLGNRFPQIVLNSESTVTITGDKTFKSEVTADAVTFNTVTTREGENYKLSDFINSLNPQTISGKKNFKKQVTFSNMFIVGETTKVNSVKAAPLLQCWIDRLSEAESIEIDKKISFNHLKTPGLKITRQGNPRNNDDEDRQGHNYNQLECKNLPCCHWTDGHWGDEWNPAQCWSSVGQNQCFLPGNPRNCDDMTDSLFSAASWIVNEGTVEELSSAELRTKVLAYLDDKIPASELSSAPEAGAGGLPAMTFLSVILSENPLYYPSSEQLEMDFDEKRHLVNHYLYKNIGLKSSILSGYTDVELARLTCRYPTLNQKDVKTDLALLDQDNVFCLMEATCLQTFAGGFETNLLEVGGNLLTLNTQKVLGVDMSLLESSRMSLTRSQTLEGNYEFADLRLASSGHFTGDISFLYHDNWQSLGGFIKKILTKSPIDTQIFTSARNVAKLTSSTSAITGDESGTEAVTVLETDYNIKAIYDTHAHLDDSLTLIEPIDFKDEIVVGTSVIVTGTVDGVDVTALAKDLVVTGVNIKVSSDSEYSISGVDSGTVAFSGKKTFSSPLTITTNIDFNINTNGVLIPIVDTSTTTGIAFVSGADLPSATNMILTLNTEQTISAPTFTVGGNVKIVENLNTDNIDSVAVSDINERYSFDANSGHVLNLNFIFGGDITIENLEAKSVDGRDWASFVADAMPRTSVDDTTVTVTGNKKFSGVVTLEKADTTLNLFNKKNLASEFADAAFIDEETTFIGSNTFSQSVTIEAGKYLAAEDSLTLTDSTITDVGNLEWLYDHTIKKSDTKKDITGKLVFTNDLTLGADSTIGSLGELNPSTDYSLSIPANLIKLDTATLTSTDGGKDRQFAGVRLNKDTQVSGLLGGYELSKFRSVLYKTGDQTISARKTFSRATMTKAVTSSSVNGLSLSDNLVYLAAANTVMQGNYKFDGDVSIQNLDVSGTIDGTDLNTIEGRLLSKDTMQNVTSTYTFQCPVLTFDEIVGDGDDSNGEGRVNGQDVNSLKAVGNTWKRITSVKLSAQAEAMVLCSHISDLSAAYLDNMEVSFYTAIGSLHWTGAAFSDIQMVQIGDFKIGLGLSGSTIHLLSYVKLVSGSSELMDPKTSLDIKSDGVSVTGARSLVVISDLIVDETPQNTYSLIALILCDEGMAMVKVFGDGTSGRFTQVGEVVPGVVGVSVSDELKQVFILTMSMTLSITTGPPYAFSVHSFPKSKLTQCASSGLCCVDGNCDDWNFELIWTGSEFNEPVNPKMDILLMPSSQSSSVGTLVLALSDGLDTVSGNFVRSLLLDYYQDAGKFIISHSLTLSLVPVNSQDFVLVSSGNEVYLVSGGQDIIVTTKLWAGSKDWKVVSTVETLGMLKNLRREDKETVSMIEGDENIVFFKYSGVDGMQLDRRIYSKDNAPLSNFSTLHSPSRVVDNLLVTWTTTNTLDWYVSVPSFYPEPVELQCRDPEAGLTTTLKSAYCKVDAEHTLCILDKPSETCNIIKNGLPTAFKTQLLTSHNDFRSKVAAGTTGVANLPTASNMRQLSWSEELSDIAQMWANQCTAGHDKARTMLDGGEVGQNILAFKSTNPWDVVVDTMTDVVKYWNKGVSEVKVDNINPFKFADIAGHFTQLAWANTDKIGCGWTQYENHAEQYPYISLVVCNYNTKGNVEGQLLWAEGSPCSECPDGYSECEESLCVKE